MLGLVFLAGLAVMAAALYALWRVVGALMRHLGFGLIAARLAAFLCAAGTVLAVNASVLREMRTFKIACETDAVREIRQTVGPIEGIRLSGNTDALRGRGLLPTYAYFEREIPPSILRINGASEALCGRGKNCSVREFSAVHELHVDEQRISDRILRIDQTVRDARTEAILGRQRSYAFDARIGTDTIGALFLMPWVLLGAVWYAPAESTCPRGSSRPFVSQVLVPTP